MRHALFVTPVLLLAACAPVTTLVPDGKEFIEFTQTRHVFESNVLSVGRCPNPSNNTCPEGTRKDMYVQTGPGWALVGAGIQTAGIVGGAALVGDGLKKSKSTNTQSVNGSQSQTNKNVPVFESPGSVVK
jgi:hypothetical protein